MGNLDGLGYRDKTVVLTGGASGMGDAVAPCPTKTAFMDASVGVLGQEFLDNFPYPILHRMATPEEQAWPLISIEQPAECGRYRRGVVYGSGFCGWTIHRRHRFVGHVEQWQEELRSQSNAT